MRRAALTAGRSREQAVGRTGRVVEAARGLLGGRQPPDSSSTARSSDATSATIGRSSPSRQATAAVDASGSPGQRPPRGAGGRDAGSSISATAGVVRTRLAAKSVAGGGEDLARREAERVAGGEDRVVGDRRRLAREQHERAVGAEQREVDVAARLRAGRARRRARRAAGAAARRAAAARRRAGGGRARRRSGGRRARWAARRRRARRAARARRDAARRAGRRASATAPAGRSGATPSRSAPGLAGADARDDGLEPLDALHDARAPRRAAARRRASARRGASCARAARPRARASSALMRWLSGDWAMWRRAAARPKCSSSATATK